MGTAFSRYELYRFSRTDVSNTRCRPSCVKVTDDSMRLTNLKVRQLVSLIVTSGKGPGRARRAAR
jgi:hypothetical protein